MTGGARVSSGGLRRCEHWLSTESKQDTFWAIWKVPSMSHDPAPLLWNPPCPDLRSFTREALDSGLCRFLAISWPHLPDFFMKSSSVALRVKSAKSQRCLRIWFFNLFIYWLEREERGWLGRKCIWIEDQTRLKRGRSGRQQDGSMNHRTCHKVWWPEFSPRDSHDGGIEPTPVCCPLTSAHMT